MDPQSKESKGVMRNLSKKTARSTHEFLQKLGKAEKTVDELYEENVKRIAKQEIVETKLHKNAQVYLRAIQGMVTATRSFGESLTEVYDEETSVQDSVAQLVAGLDLMWADLQARMQEFLVNALVNHLKSFPDIKAKMAKHDRKKVDFDRYRHAYHTAKTKKTSEEKLLQAEQQYEAAKSSYDEIKTQMHEELPQFYDDRMDFYEGVMTNCFSTLQSFHGGCRESFEQLLALANGGEVVKHYGQQYIAGPSYSALPASNTNRPTPTARPAVGKIAESDEGEDSDDDEIGDASAHLNPQSQSRPESENLAARAAPAQAPARPPSRPPSVSHSATPVSAPVAPTANPTHINGRAILYMCRATHRYAGQEVDELTFEAGELVTVVENDPPEDDEDSVDEGWATGVIGSRKGVFPVNFTERID